MLVQRIGDDECRAPKAVGNCRASHLSYYFNIQTGACEAFYYSGCDGNGNRFDSEEQCEHQCGRYRETGKLIFYMVK